MKIQSGTQENRVSEIHESIETDRVRSRYMTTNATTKIHAKVFHDTFSRYSTTPSKLKRPFNFFPSLSITPIINGMSINTMASRKASKGG
jgi:hypothetical protein